MVSLLISSTAQPAKRGVSNALPFGLTKSTSPTNILAHVQNVPVLGARIATSSFPVGDVRVQVRILVVAFVLQKHAIDRIRTQLESVSDHFVCRCSSFVRLLLHERSQPRFLLEPPDPMNLDNPTAHLFHVKLEQCYVTSGFAVGAQIWHHFL